MCPLGGVFLTCTSNVAISLIETERFLRPGFFNFSVVLGGYLNLTPMYWPSYEQHAEKHCGTGLVPDVCGRTSLCAQWALCDFEELVPQCPLNTVLSFFIDRSLRSTNMGEICWTKRNQGNNFAFFYSEIILYIVSHFAIPFIFTIFVNIYFICTLKRETYDVIVLPFNFYFIFSIFHPL